jgi:hypothetical protein
MLTRTAGRLTRAVRVLILSDAGLGRRSDCPSPHRWAALRLAFLVRIVVRHMPDDGGKPEKKAGGSRRKRVRPSDLSVPLEERAAATKAAAEEGRRKKQKRTLRSLLKRAPRQVKAEAFAGDAARLQAMIDAGDVKGVRRWGILALRGSGVPAFRILARVLSEKVDTGVNAVFRKSKKSRRTRGRPLETGEHRKIAEEVYRRRAKLIGEGVPKSKALRKACEIESPKHGLAWRTIQDIFQQSPIAKDDRFLRRATRKQRKTP